MTLARWVLAGVLTGLAGCSSAPPGYVGRFAFEAPDSQVDPFGTRSTLPLVVVPASAGPILTVRDVPYANGQSQDILLGGARATAGENKIEVEIARTPAAGGAVGDQLTIAAPAAETIDDDLARLFPGVEMHVAPDVISGYGRGSFSYATGSRGTTNCIFAWRYTAATQPLTLFEGASGMDRSTALIRLRLCRSLPMSALLDVVQQLAGSTGGGADPMLGGVAGPVFSRRSMPQSNPDQPMRHAHAARPRHHATAARTRARAVEAPDDLPGALAAPRIPLPGDVIAAPRRLDQAPSPAPDSNPASDLPMPRS